MAEKIIQCFAAPWGFPVRMVTGISLFVCAGAPVIVLTAGNLIAAIVAAALVWTLVLLTLLFGVRGYVITDSTLNILRVGWQTTFALGDIESCRVEPRAMQRSIRLAGNAGLFAVTGLFRNSTLGNFRAFATDPEKAVVLVLKDSIVVVTPDNPRAFVEALEAAKAAVP